MMTGETCIAYLVEYVWMDEVGRFSDNTCMAYFSQNDG